MGKFRPFLTELSAHNTSVFYFQDNNLNKSQLIFTSVFYFQDNNLNKSQLIFTLLDICIGTVKICFGIAHW